jgi:hydroxyethylthiazole kinase-like uncharacterized protein yjeF
VSGPPADTVGGGPPPKAPPALGPAAHKGVAGRLLCVAGSDTMPGAALLAVRAAQRGGAGLVALATASEGLQRALPVAAPEAVLVDLGGEPAVSARALTQQLSSGVDRARLVGPGLGTDVRARALLDAVLRLGGPLVIDADGLNLLAGRPERLRGMAGPIVLTPHPGEMARLLGREIPADPAGRAQAARELAQRSAAVCVLKGAATVVLDTTGGTERLWTNSTGNPGMATAGSGDVLTGLLGAFLLGLGSGFDAFDAACAAVWAHGRAGDLAAARLGRRALIASDLIDALPGALRELDGESPAAG